MPLNLNDLLKKAEKKGIGQQNTAASSLQPLRPWQQESTLYRGDEKLVANREQTDSNILENREQTESKSIAYREQSDSIQDGVSRANRKQSDIVTESIIGSKPKANRKQSDSKPIANISFSELVGLQRDIIIFICNECKNSRSKITESLTLEYIAKSLNRSSGAVKNAIMRLEKKSCLIRVGFKNGRGGWSRYEVPDSVYHDALRIETSSKQLANREQSDSKVIAQSIAQSVASFSSSSSLNINKTTTTELSTEWNFDISLYARFGFTSSQLKQLAALGVISAADVEQSLIEFSYDLDNNALPPIKTNKINFLMGLLRAGHSYVSEGFKNEQEALIAEMVRRAEDKRKKGLEEKFIAWEMKLSEEEREEIKRRLPTSLIVLYRAHGMNNPEVRNWLFDYFLNYAR